jgi:DNA invertase Pin-like site-specific DNA recombinase
MKAIILARVSDKDQEDNNSIPAQTRRMKEYADRVGLDIAAICQIVESSTKAERSKFAEIVQQIRRSKEPIALITDTIDRLQRSFRESVMLDELRKAGKLEIHFMRESLVINQKSNSADILRWDMGVLFAKSYVTQLSDNVKRSIEEKLSNGEWIGKAPFGYTNTQKDGKVWVEQDGNAPIIQAMFKLYASGAYSIRSVRAWLNETYSLNKTPSWVEQTLKNPFYYGYMLIKGTTYKHNYTPIISEDLYNAARAVAGNFGKTPYKYAGLPFLYRGLIKCGECGCRITPERSKGLVYYHCTQYKGKHNAAWLREEVVTEQIEKALSQIRPTKEQYDEVVTALKLSHADKIKFRSHQLSQINTETAKTEARLSRLYDSYLDGDITKEAYKAKNLELKRAKERLTDQLNSLDNACEVYYSTSMSVMELAYNAPLLFKEKFKDGSKDEEKREILKLLFQNLEIKSGQLGWEYKKPFDRMAFCDKNSNWLPLLVVFRDHMAEIGQTLCAFDAAAFRAKVKVLA